MTDSRARNERIYLTGFMGSGKSTIGPILANTIGYQFVDIDRAIEKSAGKSVNEIFLERGEDHFRLLERELLAGLNAVRHHVISLGGGTFADPENCNTISTSGIVVYLKTTPEHIFKRLLHKNDRPVLKNEAGERLNDGQLHARIAELYRQREPFYAKADIVILTGDKKVGITVDEIVRQLSPFLK
jgi:shikimate kinase